MGAGVARATGGTLVTIEGGGHTPHVRHPVKVNVLIRRFMDEVVAPRAQHKKQKVAALDVDRLEVRK
jgi:hypothetical protein